MSAITTNVEPAQDAPHSYVVVARRYRPQAFGELIGQEHVAQALSNAISTNRVGHAYLFTGARGVGKTSAARILAKALNCERGPTPQPCNECDICQSIGTGEDVDVLEIDGASNRGIDEIRQLRQNAGVRPSRSRYKIYIIDEVHMLTREAFNALLKTLEEPPEHVKFIFCTTEATKIPITILSRCQRFDFAGILARSIRQRLEQIVKAEGVEAESEALDVLARRAAGSMRDSQSLLEQLLAFAPGKITIADVYGMLGAAGDERLAAILGHLIERNAAAALTDFDAAIMSGVDAGGLIEQLFGTLRDCMVSAAGCSSEAFLYTSPSSAEAVVTAGKRLGLGTLMAVMQILDQTLSRMRYSTQGRILGELALVRISQLEDLEELSEVIAQLQSGVAVQPIGDVKKKFEPAVTAGSAAVSPTGSAAVPAARSGQDARAPDASSGGTPATDRNVCPPVGIVPTPQNAEPTIPFSAANALEIWTRTLARMSGMVVEQARQFDSAAVALPNRLVIRFKPKCAVAKTLCEPPGQLAKFEQALAEVTGQPMRIEFALSEEVADDAEPPPKAVPVHQLRSEVAKRPFVRHAMELYNAQVIDVIPPDASIRN